MLDCAPGLARAARPRGRDCEKARRELVRALVLLQINTAGCELEALALRGGGRGGLLLLLRRLPELREDSVSQEVNILCARAQLYLK